MTRLAQLALVMALAACAAGCGSGTGDGSLWNEPPQQPDKSLFDAGARAFANAKYHEAVTLWETLTNAYPDSPFVERAKLTLDDCDRIHECALIHEEAKTCSGQPECQIFFPNMPSDSRTVSHNLRLSVQRAQSVAAWLQDHGMNRSRLQVKGFGQSNPRYPNTNEEARARNRRVEIVVRD